MFILIIILIILILVILAYLQTPAGKGMVGEYIIRFSLGKNIPGEKYIINDLIIKGNNGKTSQIDHIVINKNGIFVIETKNYSGIIYGDEAQINWTQSFNYGKVRNPIYNPVKQNATHIYRLREITGIQLPIKSIIVFIQGNIEYIKSDKVYTIMQMRQIINSPQQKRLTSETVESLYNQIINLKQQNTVTYNEHIDNIYKTLEETEQGICPRCSGKLVERKGKYGTFYGCSNYPKCRFTKK